MAIGKRSLFNDHMITVLNKVAGMDPEPVQKSYLYYSQAEKEAVDYMISVDLLKEKTFVDSEGKEKKGYVLGDFGRDVLKEIINLQMRIDLQERIAEDPSKKEIADELQMMRTKYNSAVEEGSPAEAKRIEKDIRDTERMLMQEYHDSVDRQVEELDSRGNKKMATINRWKQQQKRQ